MLEPHKAGTLGKIAKSIIPITSAFVTALGMDGLLRYAETGAALLQGKGAGSGWNLQSEIDAAAACIKRPDPVLLDVGANYGQWAEGMLQAFPAAKRVILCEPQERCLVTLRSLNLPGRVIVPSAISDRTGTDTFYVGPDGWVAASLYERSETFFAHVQQRQITIPVTTLDTVLEKEEIEFVDFAKFDIEGSELAAFRGAERAFSRQAIAALAFEFGSANINSRTFFRDFWEFLTGHGFRIFRVLPNGHSLRLHEYYEDCEYFRGVSNYIAHLTS